VPFFKTFGAALRTQICDSLNRFSAPVRISLQARISVPARFSVEAHSPGFHVPTRAASGSFQPIRFLPAISLVVVPPKSVCRQKAEYIPPLLASLHGPAVG
jgi:hypothetical protein